MGIIVRFLGVMVLLPFMLALEACLLPIVLALAIVGFPFYLGIAMVTLSWEDFIDTYSLMFMIAITPFLLLVDFWNGEY